MRPEPSAAEVLLGLALPLGLASLAMVHAMVKWSGYLLAVPADPAAAGRKRAWGIAYGVLWLVIIATLVRFMWRVDGRLTAKNLGMLALVGGGFWAVHGLIVWFARALARADARAAAAAPPDGGAPGETEEEEAAADEDETVAAEAPPAPAAPRGSWRDRLGTVGMLLFVLGVIVLGELSPLMQALDAAVARQEAAWLAGTIALAAVGFLFLMGGAIDMVLTQGKPLSRREIEAMARIQREVAIRPGTLGNVAYRIRGAAVGSQAAGQVSFTEMKAAWRTGLWRHSRRWQRVFAMAFGGLGLCLGAFGIPFVLGTAGVKTLVLVVWGFVLVQVVRGFRRA